jgi:pimeloyl-ACP methyl ester carboxylesterase
MLRSSWIVAFLTLLMPLMSQAAQIYDSFPDVIHSDERYVIYSHGLIVEGGNSRPVHPEFGVYDFPAVKQALFESGGFNLIAHHRPKNTQTGPYVATLESWVRRLVAAGVKPSRITLVGFSRGGALSAHASSRLRDLGINTALLACCIDGDVESNPPLVLSGNLLSIFETSDAFGSCKALAARSKTESFEEIAISTGLKHGAFYRPVPEWVTPLKAWIARTNQ